MSEAIKFDELTADPSFDTLVDDKAKYSDLSHKALAAGEGFTNTATFGLYNKGAELADKALGFDPEERKQESLKTREANPISYGAGQVAGLLSGRGAVKVATKLAETVAARVSHPLISMMTKGAIENALFQSGDEVSKKMLNDPRQSMETAVASIGGALMLGGLINAGGYGLGKGATAAKESKVGKYVGDFKDRVLEHMQGAIPDEAASSLNPNYFKFGTPATEPMFKVAEPLSAGHKAADAFVNQALDKLTAKGAAATVGGLIGRSVGHKYIGALLGERLLGDAFESTIHTIIKPLLQGTVDGPAFQAALKYTSAVMKGEAAVNKAVVNVFKDGAMVLSDSMLPSEKDRKRLEAFTQQGDPESVMNVGSILGQSMPDHATVLGHVSADVTNYLDSVRPKENRQSPLDRAATPTLPQKQAYQEALDIAHQPLLILKQVKSGRVSPQSLAALQAMYPALDAKLKASLSHQMINHLGKGGSIPYQTTLGLSAYLGQPLESSILPYNIIANQSVGGSSSQQQQMQPGAFKRTGKGMDKLPRPYATTSQARELNRSSRIK